jgi:hypothetical protein
MELRQISKVGLCVPSHGTLPQIQEPCESLRWSRFKHFAGPELFRVVDVHAFLFIRALNMTAAPGRCPDSRLYGVS